MVSPKQAKLKTTLQQKFINHKELGLLMLMMSCPKIEGKCLLFVIKYADSIGDV